MGLPLHAQFLAPPSFIPISIDFPQIQIRAKLTASMPIQLDRTTVKITEGTMSVEDVAIATSTAKQILLLLLDRSSSLEGVMTQVKKSAAAFITSIPPTLKTAVISFASDIEINQEFTVNRQALAHSIEVVRAWGGTVLYDAAYVAIESLYANSDPRDLRTLVLFTDGRDETPVTREQMSSHSLNDVLNLATKKGVRIIAVGMGELIDSELLKRMARETRGWYLFAPTPAALFGIYQKIARRLEYERHYNLSYLTPNPARDGKPRELMIELHHPGGTETIKTSYVAPLPLEGTLPVNVQVQPKPPETVSQTTISSNATIDKPSGPGLQILEERRKRPVSLNPGTVTEPSKPFSGTGSNSTGGVDLPEWGEVK